MDNLIQNIQTFFLEQYKDLSTTNSFLAFEPLGCIINPDEYKDDTTGTYNQTKADEEISEIADRVPVISDVFIPGLEQVSSQYEILANGVKFNVNAVQGEDKSDYIALLGELQSKARQTIDDADRMSITTAGEKYFPATTVPATWYDAASPIWGFKAFQLEKEVTRVPDANDPAPQPKINFAWKRLSVDKIDPQVFAGVQEDKKTAVELRRFNFHGLAQATQTVNPISRVFHPAPAPAPEAEPAVKRPFLFNHINTVSPAVVLRDHRTSATPAATTPLSGSTNVIRNVNISAGLFPAANTRPTLAFKTDLTRLVLNDKNLAEVKPVESNKFSMSFQYCVVQVHRFWLDTKLFNYSKLWYSLAQEKDFFSNGVKDATNKGTLRAIPKAFIIIKDLSIEAAWSANDMEEAKNSVGLGMFNLQNSEMNDNKLTNPSLQIIGWLCEAMPQMPVSSDPNMAG